MKYMNIVLCLMLTSCVTIRKNDLSKMHELDRNKQLTKIARENINKYASDYYSDNMIQKIKSFTINNGENIGRKAYSVAYYSSPEKILKDQFSVLVCIFSDTGKAYLITSEEGMGIQINENDQLNESLKLRKTTHEKGWDQN